MNVSTEGELPMSRFKKNRYYNGKHLTSESFLAEQEYHSKKLSFMAGLYFGNGIITGFSVSQAYDDVLEINKGAGIDGNGNFLVLEETKLIAVRTVKGYSDNRKPLILKAVYSQNNDTDNRTEYITEDCGFEFDAENGAELAEIVFENEKIINIRDLRKIKNSCLFRHFSVNMTNILEKRLIEEERKTNEILKFEMKRMEKKLSEAETRIPSEILKSGTVVIKSAKSRTVYTDEIFCNFHNKSVYITFGTETSETESSLNAEVSEIIYGDGELFNEYRETSTANVLKKAVRVFPERNSFILAAQLSKPVPDGYIKFRWFVFAAENGKCGGND